MRPLVLHVHVRNLGAPASFQLQAADTLGFVDSMVPDLLTLGTGEIGTFEVNVAVPADTAQGTETLLVATATSTDEPTVTNSATIRLMASEVANVLPIANAGPDQDVKRGRLVTLNGSESFDPDNSPDPLSFTWVQMAGPEAILTGASTATPSFTPIAAGQYTFALIVSDGEANSLPDAVTITVLEKAPE